jgi:hypothetical protein
MTTRLTHADISKRLGPAVWRAWPHDVGHETPLMVYVIVHDHKLSYGKDRWLVGPVAGEGTRWVETSSLLWGER